MGYLHSTTKTDRRSPRPNHLASELAAAPFGRMVKISPFEAVGVICFTHARVKQHLWVGDPQRSHSTGATQPTWAPATILRLDAKIIERWPLAARLRFVETRPFCGDDRVEENSAARGGELI